MQDLARPRLVAVADGEAKRRLFPSLSLSQPVHPLAVFLLIQFRILRDAANRDEKRRKATRSLKFALAFSSLSYIISKHDRDHVFRQSVLHCPTLSYIVMFKYLKVSMD